MSAPAFEEEARAELRAERRLLWRELAVVVAIAAVVVARTLLG